MQTRFNKIIDLLPVLLEQLVNKQSYPIKSLTKSKIESILGQREPVAGVYLISCIQDNLPVYVGRSKTLAQRIGIDHRALQKTQASLAYKLTTLGRWGITNMAEAREYMFSNFHVRMIPIGDEYTRTIFEVYASMTLNTKYNSFMEH